MFRVPTRRRQWSVMRRLRFARTVRQSVLFIAGNRFLWSQAPRKMPTLIQPTPVDADRYAPKTEIPERGRAVGWIGTASNLPYLSVVSAALADLAARRGDLVFRVIGPEPPPIPGVEVVRVPWSEAGESAALRELDVGIAPLTDDPWSRGKCSFKALQYMAAGIPVVASPIGMNADVVADGVTGYHAGGAREWTSYLDRLLSGPVLRESMGRAGRRRVERLYDVAVLGPRLARNLKALLR
jgi:glycosyltransferase involved in cell wall biosynthesis